MRLLKTHFHSQNFLILRAAGNNGDDGFGTIFTQAAAKNIITVGASFSTHDSFLTFGICILQYTVRSNQSDCHEHS
jgi:hypothetical protein